MRQEARRAPAEAVQTPEALLKRSGIDREINIPLDTKVTRIEATNVRGLETNPSRIEEIKSQAAEVKNDSVGTMRWLAHYSTRLPIFLALSIPILAAGLVATVGGFAAIGTLFGAAIAGAVATYGWASAGFAASYFTVEATSALALIVLKAAAIGGAIGTAAAVLAPEEGAGMATSKLEKIFPKFFGWLNKTPQPKSK